jgi:type VI secretion system protein ImpA
LKGDCVADLPDGFDLDALLAPIPGDSPVGIDIREDYSAQSPYSRLRDARSEARDAEKLLDAGNADAADPTPLWRTVRDLAQKTLKETAKDIEVAAWLTEAMIRGYGLLGLAAGARTIGGLAEKYWDTVYPLSSEEYGLEDRIAPVQGLNGADGGGSLMQPLNKIPLFDRPDGSTIAYYQYQSSEQMTTLDKVRLEARIKAGGIPFGDVEKEARLQQRHLDVVRSDARSALRAWEGMAKVLDDKAGPDSPSTSHVRELLRTIMNVANRYAPPEAAEPDTAAESDGDAAQQEDADMGTTDAGPTARAAPGQVLNREGALKQLEELSAWFRRTEPHSPLAYTLEEAVRRGRLTWPELLEELLTDKNVRDELLVKLGIRPSAAVVAPAVPAA